MVWLWMDGWVDGGMLLVMMCLVSAEWAADGSRQGEEEKRRHADD